MHALNARSHGNCPRRLSRGVTRAEVLVILAIVALAGGLAPMIATISRESIETGECAANLRKILQHQAQYAIENDDWIVGSPNSSGRHVSVSVAAGAVTQVWDFMGPVAKLAGYIFNEAATTAAMTERFNQQRFDIDMLNCPANGHVASHFNGPDAGPGPMISYNTSRYMMFRHSTSNTNGVYDYANQHHEKLPIGWIPKVATLGELGRKVFCLDGARYSTSTIPPDYDLAARATWGGSYADAAPYNVYSRSWYRHFLFDQTGFDARLYAFRHGDFGAGAGAPADALKANVAFFDGHVSLMGDLQAGDPGMYLPVGSRMHTASLYPDVIERLGLQGQTYMNVDY